jgi:hypothetical protein
VLYKLDVDRTAVSFHARRILLSQHNSKQSNSGVLGFEKALTVIEANSEHHIIFFRMIWNVKRKSKSS